MAVAALATTALAKNYTVDGSTGWDTYVNYDKWTAGKTFMVGDNIGNPIPSSPYNIPMFKYEVYHNVLEVTKADYASCATGSPISTHSGGDTTFELTEAGTRYFICGIPRHCSNGTMHVKITTVAYDATTAAAIEAAAAPGAAPSSAPLPSPPADVYSDARTAPAGAPGASTPKSSAPRYQRTSAAVAGLAFAALLAIAA
ncbi:blue copper protein-like [Lolium rigidum]|uniref:blue copper protein-like n=1 Tax=Lolium rigidum TaxID=89674 RepID=UPI001F5DEC97|nr:blue copper protein-like [Lolium rigidum]